MFSTVNEKLMQYIIKELESGLYVADCDYIFHDIHFLSAPIEKAVRFSKKEAKRLLKNTTTNGVYTIIPVYFVES